MKTVRIFLNGTLVDSDTASISLFDYGFLFGDSIYEVLKSVKGRLFAVDLHLKRLRYSADKTGLPIPWSDQQIISDLQQVISALGCEFTYLRLVITRGQGPFFFDPSQCAHPSRIIYGTEYVPYPQELLKTGVKLTLSEFRKGPSRHEGGSVKTGNYLDHILPRHRAQEKGFNDALMLNHRNEVTECTSANIFWLKGRILYTPSLEMGVLNGVTRQLVTSVAENLGIKVVEGRFTLDQLLAADEVFITSTTRDILPVQSIGQSRFAMGQVTHSIIKGFLQTGLG